MRNTFTSRHLAIDLGNNNTLLSDQNGLRLDQPSYIVFNEHDRSVNAIGDDAYNIYEKNHQSLKTVKPLHWGVITDDVSCATMLDRMVRKVYPKQNWFTSFQQIVAGIPFCATAVERQALRNAISQFHSRKASLLFEPLSAAIGMGLDIREPQGKMIVDIGGGVTEIVVISLSGIVVFNSTKIAGDSFTDVIQDYMRREYNMYVGWRTAEQMKKAIGAVTSSSSQALPAFLCKGKNIIDGVPVSRSIRHEEIAAVLDPSIETIERAICTVLETCPPELAADIYEHGIYLTGGGSLLRGLVSRFENSLKLKINRDVDPLHSVSNGLTNVLMNPKAFAAVLMN